MVAYVTGIRVAAKTSYYGSTSNQRLLVLSMSWFKRSADSCEKCFALDWLRHKIGSPKLLCLITCAHIILRSCDNYRNAAELIIVVCG